MLLHVPTVVRPYPAALTYFFAVVTGISPLDRPCRSFGIDGWVLRPDHLHAIWALSEGDADFSNRWRLIKRHVTRGYLRFDLMTQRRTAKQCGSTVSGSTSFGLNGTICNIGTTYTPIR
tara:strand:- start:1781 stop:2137 length:357 start_codon:yes stop_codon:yes gene_type:complete